MFLKVIPNKKSFDSIQIGQFSAEYEQIVNSVGKFALIPINKLSFCLCKIFVSQETHPAYVELDRSIIYSKEYLHNDFPKVLPNIVEDVDDSAIEILPPPSNIHSVTVTVVFESVFDVLSSKTSFNILDSLLKDMLRMYVFMKGSVIYLENLLSQARHGVHALIINSLTCDANNNLGFVSSKTNVIIKKIISQKYFEQIFEFSQIPKRNFPKEPYQLLKGIVDLKNKLEYISDALILPPQKVILIGPSGCGKSSLVASVAAEAGATLVSYSDYNKSNGNHAQNLKSCFLEAKALAEERSKGTCVLLVENIDLICKRRDGGSISADTLCTTLQLLSIMEETQNEPNLLIIATTNKIQNLDPALRTSSTFNFEIMMEQSEEDREEVLINLLQPLNSENYITLAKEVAHMTPGYVAADLALICHKVACKNDDRPLKGLGEWLVELKRAVAETKPASTGGALGVLKKKLTNDKSLGGLFEVKRKLRAILEEPLNNPQAYLRLGLPLPKGLLLYGPPGCAKTSLVNAVASSIPVTFLSVSSADLYSPFVGEAEQNIVDLFRRARCSAPAILFIDELDALVGRRGGREAGVHDRVLSAFLMEMDGVSGPTAIYENTVVAENETSNPHASISSDGQVNPRNSAVVVIGATNRPDVLDAALLRPGRFDKLVYVPAPNNSERVDILRHVTATMPLNADVDLNKLAAQTELFSGADLAHLCTTAALNALAMNGMSVIDIRIGHFDAALKTMKPSLTAQQVEWYEEFARGS